MEDQNGQASLDPFFKPRSVAVLGASRHPGKVGHRIFRSLVEGDFQGSVFPVNPEARHVGPVKAYPSVADIPDRVDLAVVAVPAPSVAAVVRECGEAGVKAVVVISAGFAETGDEGREREEKVAGTVRDLGMRMVGPNCLGVASMDPEVRLNASFAPALPPHGRAALCSQSGALGIAVMAQARRESLGLSHFASVGNKADVAAHDLVEHWGGDEATDVILLYLESFEDPDRMGRVAREVGLSRPVVVVKAGCTEAGERAAGSHTAALAGADRAVDAFLSQTGMIRAASLREMFALARFFSLQPLPTGRRVAVVTNAGGPGILAVDALEGSGLEVPTLSDGTRRALESFLPDAAATENPVDMVASAGPEEYRRTLRTVMDSGEVDALVVIHTPVGLFDTADVGDAVVTAVREARDGAGGPMAVVASMVGGPDDVHVLGRGTHSIPAYPFPEEVGGVLAAAVSHREWREKDRGDFPDFPDQGVERARDICRRALEERGDGWLTTREGRSVLQAAGIRVTAGRVVGDADEAVETADEMGYPVAVKGASTTVVHKTERGMVHLDLEGPDPVREAVGEIRRRMEAEGALEAMEGFLVQPMVDEVTEVMMGIQRDPVFGPVLAFGLGGIHVEVLQDVAFRVAPITDRDAREMIREIRGHTLLTGYRGHREGDVEALEEALLRLSRLAEGIPEMAEMDLNPVFALAPGEGYRVADVRIRVSEPRR